MGSGFTGEFHRRFYSVLFANFDSIAPALSPFGPTIGCSASCLPRHSVVVQIISAWAARRAKEDLSVSGEVRKIPAVTDSRYSHGMFEISELERQESSPLFFKICLYQKKYIVLLEFE
jgi:hypothetical protein